jgi:hypothetical protein
LRFVFANGVGRAAEEVHLVTDDEDAEGEDVFVVGERCAQLELVPPVIELLQRIGSVRVKDEDGGVRAAEEGVGEGGEAFLSCGVLLR